MNPTQTTVDQALVSQVPSGPDDQLPLSFGQEQLWFLNQLSPDETAYNLYTAYRLGGPLECGLLQQALTVLVGRHASLRATFGSVDGTPVQRIGPRVEAELGVCDVRDLPLDERPGSVSQQLEAEVDRPFDLTAGPLYRFRLWRLAADEHVLFLGFHHIVVDGWSVGVIIEELSSLYRGLLAGEAIEHPESPGFAEHVQEQRSRLQGAVLHEELQYWDERLAQLPVVELPTDRPRPAVPSYAGDSVMVEFSPELLAGVRALAYQRGVSLFMVLTAALNVVQHRYTGQEDLPVGVPMLGRMEPELERVVGLFVNMTVLRTDLSGDPSFTDILERTAEASLDIYEHQEIAFEKVVQRVQPSRDSSRNPLFQVSVQVLTEGGPGLDLDGIEAEPIIGRSRAAMFDLVVNFFEGANSLRVNVAYATDLYDRWRIEAFVGHIEQVLISVAADPSLRLSEISILSQHERDDLLALGCGEEVGQAGAPIHVSVAEVARRNPSAIAAVCRGKEITYGELDHRAGMLARLLRSSGLRHEQVVAIVMDRDLDTLVAILGVLKAGAAFAMIDPTNPTQRVGYMFADTDTPLVITRSTTVDRLPESTDWETVLLDEQWDALSNPAVDEAWEEWAAAESLAYVLYTSGSTGQPKGVLVEHRSVECFVDAYRRVFDFGSADRLLQLPALTFDMSMGEIFTGLAAGATLVLVSPEEGRSPDLLADLMREQHVTYAGLPPAILSVLEPEPYPALRAVMSGADAVPAEMVNKWNLPGRQFLDLYGPTEATIACTEYVCEHEVWTTPPPIGFPELNRRVYVVDRQLNLVPKGVPGELLIGGEGLARGYLNQPESTAAKFVSDPFRAEGRVYHSGDLVRWTARRGLEFLGRMDRQVKLRGLRIELGEIEAALLSHPEVRMAVVVLGTDPRGERRLVGYVTTTTPAGLSTADLRSHVGIRLPDYMVPSAWVILDEFPLTSARKIDRAALPVPQDEESQSDQPFSPAATPTERIVADILAEVLSVERVGSDANFFALGGNSLQAMRVVSRINKAFKVKVNIRLLYGASSVRDIAIDVDALVSQVKGTDGHG